jgi:hypothetical protein
MTDFERQAPEGTPPEGTTEASEIEGGGTEQTWGQGQGTHEATIPDEETDEETPKSYSGGTAADLDDPDLPLAREDEGMDR